MKKSDHTELCACAVHFLNSPLQEDSMTYGQVQEISFVATMWNPNCIVVTPTAMLGKRKTRCACSVDADESTRLQMELDTNLINTTAKGTNSMTHYSIVTPDAKAAVEIELEKLENVPAWEQTKVRNKEVSEEARNKGESLFWVISVILREFRRGI